MTNKDIEKVPKKRGRPRKIKTITSCVADDDIIAQLIAESRRSDTSSIDCVDHEEDVVDTDEENEEEQEIEVQKIILNNVTYLIDDNDNIYDFETHDELGTYDNKHHRIIYD